MPTLTQSEHLSSNAHEVFETLMDETRHAELIGDTVSIDRRTGGTFSTFGDYATGVNIEIIPDHRIVQEWRASDWPADVTSTLTIDISPEFDGCRMTLIHEGIPDADFDAIAQGWQEYYWAPLRSLFS